MRKRPGALFLTVTMMAGVAAAATCALSATDGSNLTVHEWGTFTSIAGPNGQAIEWRPLSGPSDLPCFVTTLNPNSIKVLPQGGIPGMKALVRMETPVLYFYSPSLMTARVSVRFPQGVFSEWYPQATTRMVPLGDRQWQWQINWSNVVISPGVKEQFPTEPDQSHYYAARETDAAPVTVGGQQEKFLFYRGIATFQPPLAATVSKDGSIFVEKRHDRVDTFVLFERRGDRFGYRVVSSDQDEVRIERPVLDASLQLLWEDLRRLLTDRGLYLREAAAMVDTWRDSWFEEGTRLFYVLPQTMVDGILPISIDPAPANITRVFVGRMEVVTPEMEADVASAIRRNNRAALRKYGRFLEPISQMVEAQLKTTHDDVKIGAALSGVSPRSPFSVCQAPVSAKPARSNILSSQ